MEIGKFNEYRGYTGSIEYYYEDKIYYGSLLNIKDLVNYEADTMENLYNEFHNAVDDYIEFKRNINEEKYV